MLSAVEIVALEKKVLRYRLKQRLHYFIVISLVGAISVAGFFVYPTLLTFVDTNESHLKDMSEQTDINRSLNTTVSVPTNTDLPTPKYASIPPSNEETLYLQLPTIGKSVDKKEAYLPAPVEKKKSFGIQEDDLDTKVTTRKMPASIEDETFYRTKDEKIDTTLLPPPLLEEPKPKGVIKIETHEVNSIQYLKEKFEKTHNITFALMLAEEYYLTKNYTESNKWALIANNMDAENEKSWIWFAKTKIKLGHKDDAIVALKAYLKNNKSQAAQSLLNQITIGEVID